MNKTQTPSISDRRIAARDYDGFRYAQVARSTGTLVVVVRDSDEGYSLYCEDHDHSAPFATLGAAKTWAAAPEQWCPRCTRQARKSA